MTGKEALTLLENAPSDGNPSSINRGITRRQSVDIVRKCVLHKPSDEALEDWLEKRIHQVAQDRVRPKIPNPLQTP